MQILHYIFAEHFRLAVLALLLFALGLFLAWPVVKFGVRRLMEIPLAVFRMVLALMGPAPSIFRMATVIWSFNSCVMFIYMATGWHPLFPKIIAVLTGLNVGIVMMAGRSELGLIGPGEPEPGQWVPPRRLTGICGLLVLLLELPCFWFALAMGMSMGADVTTGAADYSEALVLRAQGYLAVIVPILLLSAFCEAVAIRGAAARAHGGPQGDGGPSDWPDGAEDV
ncbi:MAG: hypothetical protein ACOC7T_00045 [Planctomycetota bacterium]